MSVESNVTVGGEDSGRSFIFTEIHIGMVVGGIGSVEVIIVIDGTGCGRGRVVGSGQTKDITAVIIGGTIGGRGPCVVIDGGNITGNFSDLVLFKSPGGIGEGIRHYEVEETTNGVTAGVGGDWPASLGITGIIGIGILREDSGFIGPVTGGDYKRGCGNMMQHMSQGHICAKEVNGYEWWRMEK